MADFEEEQLEEDDILDNMLEEDGSEHFLYGDKKGPDADPGSKSGCMSTIVLLLVPVVVISWILMQKGV